MQGKQPCFFRLIRVCSLNQFCNAEGPGVGHAGVRQSQTAYVNRADAMVSQSALRGEKKKGERKKTVHVNSGDSGGQRERDLGRTEHAQLRALHVGQNLVMIVSFPYQTVVLISICIIAGDPGSSISAQKTPSSCHRCCRLNGPTRQSFCFPSGF